MRYGDFKDIAREASDKALRDKAFNFAENPKYDGYQHGLASIVYKLFERKSGTTYTETGIYSQNQQLAEDIHK